MLDKTLALDAQLPQTQCTDCGFQGCKPYAKAMACGEADIDLCPPGGTETLYALAKLLKKDPKPYETLVQENTRPPATATIIESECIGCTKCIQACPVDAIVGSNKQMHSILTDACTGCRLCVEPCPVDCIEIVELKQPQFSKDKARLNFEARNLRLAREKQDKLTQYKEKRKLSTLDDTKAKQAYIMAALKEKTPNMNKQKRFEIFERLQQANPTPTTELVYSNAFELLIAVILSAQATDVGVNKATKTLFKMANTPEAILALGETGLKHHIKTIGLYNAKASNIIKTCALLIKHHQSQVPDNREDLEALPGVGRKTANVVLNTAFGQPTMAVDTHIFRVANRTKLATGKTPLEVEKKLCRHIDKQFIHDAHHWLILHGRYICIARKPRCGACPIEDLCEFEHKTE